MLRNVAPGTSLIFHRISIDKSRFFRKEITIMELWTGVLVTFTKSEV